MTPVDKILLFIGEEVDRRITRNYEKVFTIDLRDHELEAQPVLQWFMTSDNVPLFEYMCHERREAYIVGLYLNWEDYTIDVICTPIGYRSMGT